MQITVTARHFRASKSLKEYTIRKISKLEKFYGGIVSCNVVLSVEKNPGHSKKVEIVLRVYGLTLTSVGQSESFLSALGAAIEKMEAQLKRYTSKLRERIKNQRRTRKRVVDA